ncbi:hypothetical protein Vadar_003202 [Vaccinium darrowii]|uniref:Uncharacterized protein n=1 Tax=Vaccinium darrowii TaxID=229202 RepID=A0ACB7Z225_9ERIC|nr:hypothetical protein Vadar_003202 [Vaccinium darrowii]
MDPIPAWVRKLWNVWDLRTLVLLSLTLQVILSIVGNRRKYISSPWINSVLVWLAYLMADWVATVALSKLSDAQGDSENTNVLWAIWAPLLLLHLGGPDGITAFSLEDNQLWMRHLMGLGVQLFVATYVILMSWKNSWFSFMSLPALVAGIIKYGERTWVLMSVSDDKYLNCLPFDKVGDFYTAEGHEYLRVLTLAYEHLKDFMHHVEEEGRSVRTSPFPRSMEDNIVCDAVEVSMGLMYDLLYTKASRIYTKKGCILRCISFGCTMTVLIGLVFRIVHFREDDNRKDKMHKIDTAITMILIVGALALEIYAAIVMFSSNWGMLWLIKQGRREWVIWLGQRFPVLFNKKKNWSKMMGQFDLLGYSLKIGGPGMLRRSPSRRIISAVLGRDYEDKWITYWHKTVYSVHPLVYNVILLDNCKPRSHSRTSYITRDELAEILEIVDLTRFDFQWRIMCMHHVTEICYHLEMEWDGGEDLSRPDSSSSLWKQYREVSKALSDYMMYLLIMQPSLLPSVGSRRRLERTLKYPPYVIGDAQEVNAACHYLLRQTDRWSVAVERLKLKGKPKRWEIIKLMWWRMLQNATEGLTGVGQKNGHFQHLRQGGELLTFIWFCYSPYQEMYFRH